MEEIKIRRAVKALGKITYQPHSTGYYVLMNGGDLGGCDYCKACINDAVKKARNWHKEKRDEIIKKHEKALKTGKYKVSYVSKSKRAALKNYPAKASFTYEGHDPDFGGGATEPHTCDGCGEPFKTQFCADNEEAEHLLSTIKLGELTDRDKWEIDIAFYHYQYSKPEVQKILLQAAELILLKHKSKNVL